MNQQKHGKVNRINPIGTLVKFLKAQPENEKVTIIDTAVLLLSRITMVLIILGVTITFFEVVMRYVFNSPTSWAYGKTLWLGAIIYLVSGTYAMQRRNHIRITAFYHIVPDWLKASFDYLTLFVIVVYTTLMLVGGAGPAIDDFMEWIRHGRLLNPTMSGTIKPLLLIMTVVVAVVTINNLLKDLCGFGHASKTSQTDREVP